MSISMCLNLDFSLNVLRSGRGFQNVNLFDLIHNKTSLNVCLRPGHHLPHFLENQ